MGQKAPPSMCGKRAPRFVSLQLAYYIRLLIPIRGTGTIRYGWARAHPLSGSDGHVGV